MQPIESVFTQLGGKFLTSYEKFQQKLKGIRGYLFDWDGVFNAGVKSSSTSSPFSEIDSMGINLLRFSGWLETGEVPFVGIITGQHNDSAFELAKREHFNACYYTFKSKIEALEHIENNVKIKPSQLLFVFDDVLDISAAKCTGLSVLIQRSSSPLFNEYVVKNSFADYITAHSGNRHAIREICELCMGSKGLYERVVDERVLFTENYKQYLEQRDKIDGKFYHKVDKKIIETKI